MDKDIKEIRGEAQVDVFTRWDALEKRGVETYCRTPGMYWLCQEFKPVLTV